MGRGLICGKSNVGRKVEAWPKKIKCPQSFLKFTLVRNGERALETA